MKNIKKAIVSTVIAFTTVTATYVMTVKPTLAQNGYDPTGKWQCTNTLRDRSGYGGSFIHEVTINAHPNSTFEAEGITSDNIGGRRRFVTQGTWTISQTPEGSGLYFVGQGQDDWGFNIRLGLGGLFQGPNLLSHQGVTDQFHGTSTCQRIIS